ncbi:DUF1844 domain-containing protein [bacterium]|nr:DUF1844 domain-containing protein [bacterium]
MSEKLDTSNPALFSSFIMGLASAAMVEMGIVDDPHDGKRRFSPEDARQHIDLLNMLQQKTRGNLDENEKQLIDRALVDLKYQFAKLDLSGGSSAPSSKE